MIVKEEKRRQEGRKIIRVEGRRTIMEVSWSGGEMEERKKEKEEER